MNKSNTSVPPASRLGRYIRTRYRDEDVNAFLPPPLPPDPPIDVMPLLGRLSAADRALGRLDGVSLLLPDKELFLYMYVRKEAVLSSQIEGTQSTLDELLKFETEAKAGTPGDDIQEVSNYVNATMYGLKRMESLPISLRFLRELHGRLLKSGRGSEKNPGEFRTSQNWIGGTRPGNAAFVPPPPTELMGCLDNFEKFLHDGSSNLPPLIRAGLLHVQFETIHPFSDGNGRVGRLLITLDLCDKKVLHQPLLYLSLYFKQHRSDYYRLLQEVRERGAWEPWLEFFLDGVTYTANEAFESAQKISDLLSRDRIKISASGHSPGSALQIFELLRRTPFITVPNATERTTLSAPTVNSAVEQLRKLGVLREITGKRRDRVYAYDDYLNILRDKQDPVPEDEETEALDHNPKAF
jgi:Fic family protein